MLSIITVNFNSTKYCIDLIQSIQKANYPNGFIQEIFVVDNGSHKSHRLDLEAFQAPLVKKFFLDQSLSFSGANNIAIEQASGRYICLLNPDSLVLDNALITMVDYLEDNPDVWAVGPQFWADCNKTTLLPPNELPTLWREFRTFWSQLSTYNLAKESLRCSRYRLKYWRSQQPQEIKILSGACIVARKKVFDQVGGLDEQFPLYYEDSDWCRRVNRAGGKLIYLPQAEIVHLYNKSAGQNYQEALRKNAVSRNNYFRKYYPLIGKISLSFLNWIGHRFSSSNSSLSINNLGTQTVPFKIRHNFTEQDCFAEISASPFFSLAAGMFPFKQQIKISKHVWGDRINQSWYVRLINSDATKVLQTWSFYLRAKSNTADWKFTNYQLGNETEILSLFQDVFHINRPLQEWNWIYQQNPIGKSILMVRNSNQELIAHYAGIPVKVKYFNRQYTFGQVVDTMIRKDYRSTIGDSDLMKDMVFKFYDEFTGEKQQQNAFLYGLPNELAWQAARRIGTSKLGYNRANKIIYLTKSIVNDQKLTSLKSELNLQAISVFDSTADEIWKLSQDNYPVSLIKNSTYLNWRYVECPYQNYFKFYVKNKEEIIGIVIFKDNLPGEQHNFPNESIGAVIDWIVPHAYKNYYPEIINLCEQWSIQHHLNRLLFLFSINCQEYKLLQAQGYQEFKSRYTLALKSFHSQVDLKQVQNNWFYTWGDFDIV